MINESKTQIQTEMFPVAPVYAHRLNRQRRADRVALWLSWLYVSALLIGSIVVLAGGR